MDELHLARWRAELDAALASDDEADLDPLWQALGAAIDTAPDHPGPRRLRARLAEACHMHAVRHADLLALHRIDATDRDTWLALATVQHRWAFLIAPQDEEEGDPPDADGGAQQDALQAQARDWFAQMLRAHAGDAAFCARVLAAWDDARLDAPWLRLALVLDACAAHPGDAALARERAAAWEDLAGRAPADYDPETSPPPMGFVFDVGGGLSDPFLQDRALAALAELIAGAPDDPGLLARRARLLEARCDFPAAADAYRDAATAAQRAAAHAPDDAQREALAQEADELREREGLCRAGRPALAGALAQGLADTVAAFRDAMAPDEGASDAARAFAQAMRESAQERADELDASLAALRDAQAASVPDEEAMAAMRNMAEQVAASILGSVQLAPMELVRIAPTAFEDDWARVLSAARATLAGLGWRELGWAEWPALRDMLGHQAVSTVWTDPSTGTVALVSGLHGTAYVDLETTLDDGRMLVTALCRGRNFLTGGPDVDTLFADAQLPLAEAAALHAARVRDALARSPGRRPMPCADLAEVEVRQEHGRARKTAFRLQHGLTRSEALGVPHDFPELFAPMLQAAVQRAVTALRRAT